MRIVHIIDSIKPGGAENVMLNYIKVSREFGFQSHIIGKKASESYESNLRDYADISYNLDSKVLNNCDCIFLHSNHALLSTVKFWNKIKKRNIKVIYIQHLLYKESKFNLLSKLINLLCTDFIQITPITSALIKKYIRIPVHYINNFYLAHYERKDYASIRATVRKDLNIDDEIKIIAFSAIFKPGKGLKDVIDLATAMRDDLKYKFLVIGDGIEADYVRNYKSDNLLWIGRKNDVEKFLIASDIYLFTSRFTLEMMPMALIEAINVGLTCFGFDTDINKYLLNNQTYNNLNPQILKGLKHYPYKLFDKEYGIKKIKELMESH